VELKSLKLYCGANRDEGAFHEDVTNRILDDVAAAVAPRASRSTPNGWCARDPHDGDGVGAVAGRADPRESHDFAHPVEGDSAWSESYYFNAYDPSTDTGLFTRIGVRPNEGTMDVGLSVWLPGGSLAYVNGVREQREMVDTGLSVNGVS